MCMLGCGVRTLACFGALLLIGCAGDAGKRALGESCESGADCESRRCDELVCKSAQPKDVGEPCSHPLECASELCIEQRCVAADADAGPGDGVSAEAISPHDAGPTADGASLEDLSRPPFVANWAVGAVSSQDGWVWHNPLPFGSTITTLWGLDASHVYAAGDHGMVALYDGSQWRGMGPPTHATLTALWGLAEDALWAATPGAIWAYDGSSWHESSLPTNSALRRIWGASRSEIWAVGDRGTIVRYDGSQWTKATPPPEASSANFNSLWGTSRSDIWVTALDTASPLLHYDGSRWSTRSIAVFGGLRGVHGSAEDDVWVVGDNGSIARYDGSAWQAVSFPWPQADLRGVWSAGPASVWVTGTSMVCAYDGSSWSASPLPTTQFSHAIWGSAPNDIWIASNNTTPFVVESTPTQLLHFDGSEWVSARRSATDHDLRAAWARAADDVWAVGGDAILHFDGTSWQETSAPVAAELNDVWAAGPNAAWAVGDGGMILSFDGTGWRSVTSPTTQALLSIWGASSSAIWAIGRSDRDSGASVLLRYDGSQWSQEADLPLAAGANLEVLWGASSSAVWVAGNEERSQGSRDLRWFFDGTQWNDRSAANYLGGPYGALGGLTATDVWAHLAVYPYGDAFLLHGQGDPLVWSEVANVGAAQLVTGFARRGADELWAAAILYDAWFGPVRAFVHRYDGSAWQAHSEVAMGNPADVASVDGAGVWVVGEGGRILYHP